MKDNNHKCLGPVKYLHKVAGAVHARFVIGWRGNECVRERNTVDIQLTASIFIGLKLVKRCYHIVRYKNIRICGYERLCTFTAQPREKYSLYKLFGPELSVKKFIALSSPQRHLSLTSLQPYLILSSVRAPSPFASTLGPLCPRVI